MQESCKQSRETSEFTFQTAQSSSASEKRRFRETQGCQPRPQTLFWRKKIENRPNNMPKNCKQSRETLEFSFQTAKSSSVAKKRRFCETQGCQPRPQTLLKKFADAADTPGIHKNGILYQQGNFKLFEKNILMFPSIACSFLACCLVDFLFSYAKTKFADAADTPGFRKIGVFY